MQVSRQTLEHLLSGDVDSLRRFLKHSDPQQDSHSDPQREGSPCSLAPVAAHRLQHSLPTCVNMYSDLKHILVPLSPDRPSIKLVNTRVMGKIVWPAGHALALHLSCSFSDSPYLNSSRAIFLEVGAGSGLPSMVAAIACSHTFPLVLATDFVEQGVQLLQANAERNHCRVECALLDVSQRMALSHLLDTELSRTERVGPAVPNRVCVCACDLCYDEAAIDGLFAAAAQAAEKYSVEIWFARSSNFEHMDSYTRSVADRHGFSMKSSCRLRASGILDSLSATYLSPCSDDQTDLFIFS